MTDIQKEIIAKIHPDLDAFRVLVGDVKLSTTDWESDIKQIEPIVVRGIMLIESEKTDLSQYSGADCQAALAYEIVVTLFDVPQIFQGVAIWGMKKIIDNLVFTFNTKCPGWEDKVNQYLDASAVTAQGINTTVDGLNQLKNPTP